MNTEKCHSHICDCDEILAYKTPYRCAKHTGQTIKSAWLELKNVRNTGVTKLVSDTAYNNYMLVMVTFIACLRLSITSGLCDASRKLGCKNTDSVAAFKMCFCCVAPCGHYFFMDF